MILELRNRICTWRLRQPEAAEYSISQRLSDRSLEGISGFLLFLFSAFLQLLAHRTLQSYVGLNLIFSFEYVQILLVVLVVFVNERRVEATVKIDFISTLFESRLLNIECWNFAHFARWRCLKRGRLRHLIESMRCFSWLRCRPSYERPHPDGKATHYGLVVLLIASVVCIGSFQALFGV